MKLSTPTPTSILVALGLLVPLACNKSGSTKTEVSNVSPQPSDEAPEAPKLAARPEIPEQGKTGGELDKTDGELTWFTTCGAPVCSGYDGPWPGVPACGPNKAGDPCSTAGATCDFRSNCNARLICAAEDPKLRPGGCPVSRARFKRDIEYLGDAELEAYYDEVQALKLATYRYRGRSDAKLELGVILEDGEQRELAVWADPANDRVDLYAYASLAIAGVQIQARELDELRAELAELRAELAELRAELHERSEGSGRVPHPRSEEL